MKMGLRVNEKESNSDGIDLMLLELFLDLRRKLEGVHVALHGGRRWICRFEYC